MLNAGGNMSSATPKTIHLINQKQYRIIPSVYPPINFFEDLVDPDEMEAVWEIESMTNERLLQEAGDIFLVPKEDRISGAGSSVVMAAFTHLSRPSRFSDGSYGVYYAGLTQETAIRETVFRRELFLTATQEEPNEIAMRVYEGRVEKPLHDIRQQRFDDLHHPQEYHAAQSFGKALRGGGSWGLLYNSVRHDGGKCIAAFRPPTVSIPIPAAHLKYVWDGKRITDVLNAEPLIHL